MCQAVGALRRGTSADLPLWQLRLVVELWDGRVLRVAGGRHDALLTSEFLPVMKNMVDAALDSWLKGEERPEGGREKECEITVVWLKWKY